MHKVRKPIGEKTITVIRKSISYRSMLFSELAESCEKALPKKERDVDPICRVPLITSAKEEQVLIGASTKVRRSLSRT